MELDDLARRVRTDEALADRIRANPVQELDRLSAEGEPAYRSDVWTYRLVVIFLGVVALGVVIGTIILFGVGKKGLPAGVIALASAAVGALAGLLAPSPGSTTKKKQE